MRLIDADFLRGLVNKKLEEDWGFLPKKFLFGVRDLLDSTPTVDAVEVVRCKNCKHYDLDDGCGLLALDYVRMEIDDFCSCGERKTDGLDTM